MVETELKNEHVNTLSAYLLNLINREAYVKDIRLFGLQDYLYKRQRNFASVGRMYKELGCRCGKYRAVPTFAAQMFAAVTYICIDGKSDRGKHHDRGSDHVRRRGYHHGCRDTETA